MQVRPEKSQGSNVHAPTTEQEFDDQVDELMWSYDLDGNGKIDLGSRVSDNAPLEEMQNDETRFLVVVDDPARAFDGPLAAFRAADELGNHDGQVTAKELTLLGHRYGIEALDNWDEQMWSPDGTPVEPRVVDVYPTY